MWNIYKLEVLEDFTTEEKTSIGIWMQDFKKGEIITVTHNIGIKNHKLIQEGKLRPIEEVA